ncbi:MAG: stage III sporulation protein AB [Ruminococcus sp.]|nr:stage III sporulation protein AB [Ruminococcus sp.]
MLKLFLCLLILFSGALLGIHLSQRLNRRREVLTAFEGLFHRAAIQIEYNAGDLCEIFSDNFAGFPFDRNNVFSIQWSCFINSFSYVLTKDEITLLLGFTDGLGTSDCESQIKHIKLYTHLLQEQIIKAREDIKVKSKMYRIVPLSAGIALALLMI